MARGRNQGAAAQPKARANAKATAVPRVSAPKTKAAPAPKKGKSTESAPAPDLKAALPYFLIRIAVFLVLTVVLILVGFYVLWALLIGMIAASVVTWPIARIQKRVSRRNQAKTGKATK